MTNQGWPGGSVPPGESTPPEPAAPPAPEQSAPEPPAPESAAPPTSEQPASEQPTSEPPADPTPAAPDQSLDGPRHRRATPPAADSMWARYRARRQRKKAAKAQRPRRKAPWWELPALVVLAILIAIVVKTFIVQPFYIPSESMEKTLHGCTGCHGDRILVNKLIYDFRDPNPGDIVVFRAPPGWDDEPTTKPPGNPILRGIRGFGQLIGFVPPDGEVLVKRVIANGGESIKGDAQGNVYVHGPGKPWRELHEPYVYRTQPGDGDNGHGKFGPLTVPKGRLWVMGDHRDDSQDSRFHCSPDAGDSGTANCAQYVKEATVPLDDVIGKAFVIAWPPSRWRTLGTPPTFESAALAGASDVPGMVSTGIVVPIFALRRRRRRR